MNINIKRPSADHIKEFLDAGGAVLRPRHAELALSAAIDRGELTHEVVRLSEQLEIAIEECDVNIALLRFVIGSR
jgi:hypothetical protein